ncbi:hypothetical protein TIFTF001_004324 [Ficus carica]|uniref:Uncharacterized protein n=1 Tax=Ficus carica TaxID=3494 RepID=A0AA87ZB93_FICCA|nr:hypothetical protein TIFTF001_004324 [Ficus carica]
MLAAQQPKKSLKGAFGPQLPPHPTTQSQTHSTVAIDQIHGGSRWLALVDLLSPAAVALARDGEAHDSAERLTTARALNGDGFAGGKVLGAGGGEVSDGCLRKI